VRGEGIPGERCGAPYNDFGILLARATGSQAHDHKHNLPASIVVLKRAPSSAAYRAGTGSETTPRGLPAQQQFPVSQRPFRLLAYLYRPWTGKDKQERVRDDQC